MNKELLVRKLYKEDFEFYARHELKIRTKSGELVPLILNKAQRYVHETIERQLAEKGRVRVFILKGRQQGVSTYVEARGYWKATHTPGMNAYILTHEQQATDNIFKMVSRYHHNCSPEVRPSTGKSNAKELIFDEMDSGYRVGTAGTKDVGRSATVQFFHGSEVSAWANAADHAAGIMQAIAYSDLDTEGVKTEVINESTAKGIGNYFHEQCKLAESGESDFELIFIPWFWNDEYRRPVPDGYSPTNEEAELKAQYGVDDEQICFRRAKIIELSVGGVNGERKFKEEYPMNAAEAFQASGMDSLITPEAVMRARRVKDVEAVGPVIAGVDPSHGGDRFALVVRQGRKIYGVESYVRDEVNTFQKRVGVCVDYMKRYNPHMMFIDQGFGADIVDYLRYNLNCSNVKGIAFGSTPNDQRRYKNKRAEMFGNFADWLNDENMPVSVPDSDSYHADVTACPYFYDANRRITIYPKEYIKKEFGFSPDLADASALTFAETVALENELDGYYEYEDAREQDPNTGY